MPAKRQTRCNAKLSTGSAFTAASSNDSRLRGNIAKKDLDPKVSGDLDLVYERPLSETPNPLSHLFVFANAAEGKHSLQAATCSRSSLSGFLLGPNTDSVNRTPCCNAI